QHAAKPRAGDRHGGSSPAKPHEEPPPVSRVYRDLGIMRGFHDPLARPGGEHSPAQKQGSHPGCAGRRAAGEQVEQRQWQPGNRAEHQPRLPAWRGHPRPHNRRDQQGDGTHNHRQPLLDGFRALTDPPPKRGHRSREPLAARGWQDARQPGRATPPTTTAAISKATAPTTPASPCSTAFALSLTLSPSAGSAAVSPSMPAVSRLPGSTRTSHSNSTNGGNGKPNSAEPA